MWCTRRNSLEELNSDLMDRCRVISIFSSYCRVVIKFYSQIDSNHLCLQTLRLFLNFCYNREHCYLNRNSKIASKSNNKKKNGKINHGMDVLYRGLHNTKIILAKSNAKTVLYTHFYIMSSTT